MSRGNWGELLSLPLLAVMLEVGPKAGPAAPHTAALATTSGSAWSMLGDTRLLGQATLIAVAAVLVGLLVRRIAPKFMNPTLVGGLASLAVVAGLAAAGVPTAGVVLWAALAVAAALLVLAFVFN